MGHAHLYAIVDGSDVMESMMKIMTSPSTLHSLGVGSYDMDEDEQYDAYPQAMRGGGGRLPMDPSACIFWCAVALGGLVKGQPIETVSFHTLFMCVHCLATGASLLRGI